MTGNIVLEDIRVHPLSSVPVSGPYGYCNQIKLGHKTPHPHWWEVLRELV